MGLPGPPVPDAHFDHLAVEEISKVLPIDIGCDAANIQVLALPRQVRVTADAHSKCLDRYWGQQSWNTKNGWYRKVVVCTGKI